MRNLTTRHTRFWSSDKSLSGLLAILFIGIFVLYPLGEIGVVGEEVSRKSLLQTKSKHAV